MEQNLWVNESTRRNAAHRLEVTNKGNTANTEPNNTFFKFGQAYRSFSPEPYIRENGSSASVIAKDRGAVDPLGPFIRTSNIQTSGNHNNIMSVNSTQLKMAASNALPSGANPIGVNTNGFQLPMSSTPEIQTKTQGPGLSMSPKIHLNSSVLDQSNSGLQSPNLTPTSSHLNPSSMKFMSSGQTQSQGILPQQNQYNQHNANRQEIMQRSFNSALMSQEFPSAPRGTPSTEQYGGSQQRFMSASNEQQIRGPSSRTSSPFHPNYYPQEVNTSRSSHRTGNLQPDERNLITKPPYWSTTHRNQTYCPPSISPGASAAQAMNRSPLQVR